MTKEAIDALHRDIPAHCHSGLIGYIDHHAPMGSFLTAIFENDFMRAACSADDKNLAALPQYARWLYNYAPSTCHGSPAKVAAWLDCK